MEVFDKFFTHPHADKNSEELPKLLLLVWGLKDIKLGQVGLGKLLYYWQSD